MLQLLFSKEIRTKGKKHWMRVDLIGKITLDLGAI